MPLPDQAREPLTSTCRYNHTGTQFFEIKKSRPLTGSVWGAQVPLHQVTGPGLVGGPLSPVGGSLSGRQRVFPGEPTNKAGTTMGLPLGCPKEGTLAKMDSQGPLEEREPQYPC